MDAAPTPESATQDSVARDPVADYPDDEVEAEFAPHRRQRLGKATAVLAVLVIAGGGFLAGAYVQKTQAPAATTGVSRTTFAGATGGGGAGRTGRAAASAAAPSGAAAPGNAAADDAGPAVIGQVVKVTGDTVVVQNLGGKQVTVTLSPDTTVSKAASTGDLAPGQTVTVAGTTGADGTVAATTVLSR